MQPARAVDVARRFQMTLGHRYFFCHLQKTAGSSLIRRLKRCFREDEIYPNREDGEIVTCVLSVSHLLRRWCERRARIRFVSGHFPLCTEDLLGGGFRTFTVLREPVERTLSYLRHYRKMTPDEAHRPLEALYADPIRFPGLVQNHMVKMLSISTAEMNNGVLTIVPLTRIHLERAKERLAGLSAFGLQRQFEEFCDEIAVRFDLMLGPPAFANRTLPLAVSQAFRDRIAEENSLDVELYDYAERLWRERKAIATATLERL
jgi:hypothetical protein